nr:RNA-directed DNA polymerase, eukaryota [Tanacetum cinerariifolium]
DTAGQGDDTAAQEDDTTAHGDDAQEPCIPFPTPPTPPPQQPHDLPLTSQRVDTSEDTVMDDASNHGRVIDDLDKDDVVSLMDDKEEDKKEEEAKDEPAEVHAVVDVVTTSKLITEVVTAASETVTTASIIIFADEPQVPAATITVAPVRVAAASTRRRKGVVIRDPEEESTTSSVIPADTKKLHAKLNKDIKWDVAIEHVKQKAKEDPTMQRYQVTKKKPQTEAQARKNMIIYLKNVAGFRLDYFKGMSYDDIRPIFEAKFNSNIEFILKTKEQMEEEESRALQSINETAAQKAAKRRKLNEEVEDLKRHLEIFADEDDDVYTEATPLARNVHIVDYEIINLNNKSYYKIIRADGTHQLYISFLALLKKFDKEDLEALLNLVKERYQDSQLHYDLSPFYEDDAVFVGVGIPNDLIVVVASTLGCSIMKTPFKYLGVTVGEIKECSVAIKLQGDVEFSLRPQVRGGVEAQQLVQLQDLIESSVLVNAEDRWFWDLNGNGVFYVKDVRKLLDESFLPNEATATRWVKFVSIKINVFAWKVSLDR